MKTLYNGCAPTRLFGLGDGLARIGTIGLHAYPDYGGVIVVKRLNRGNWFWEDMAYYRPDTGWRTDMPRALDTALSAVGIDRSSIERVVRGGPLEIQGEDGAWVPALR